MDTESPYSNADSAVKSIEDGLTYFVKPFELVCSNFREECFCIQTFRLGRKAFSEEERSSLNARISLQRRPLTLRLL